MQIEPWEIDLKRCRETLTCLEDSSIKIITQTLEVMENKIINQELELEHIRDALNKKNYGR